MTDTPAQTPTPRTPTQTDSGCDFTVCVLLYGDHPNLALRCLTPLSTLVKEGLIALRIGTNAVSDRTNDVVASLGLGGSIWSGSANNIKKYPMMKRLFSARGDACQGLVPTPYVMWFDDDSYISSSSAVEWLSTAKNAMRESDLIGSLYDISLKGNQVMWLREQPWFAGVPILEGHRVIYCTGGWWTVRAEILQKFSWPIPDLLHRGGDVMLGELCRQQQLRITHFNDGISINADADGIESKAPRRGYDSRPIGWDYKVFSRDPCPCGSGVAFEACHWAEQCERPTITRGSGEHP